MNTGCRARSYQRPSSLELALALLEAESPVLLAGGTAVMANSGYDWLAAGGLPNAVLDLTNLLWLRRSELGREIRLGALMSYAELRDAWFPSGWRALSDVASTIVSPQVARRATLMGNVCAAQVGSDAIPALLALGAEVELRSVLGTRRMAVSELVRGPGRIARERAELATAILLPAIPPRAYSSYRRLTIREGIGPATYGVAAYVELAKNGAILRCRVVSTHEKRMFEQQDGVAEGLLGSKLSVRRPEELSEIAARAVGATRPEPLGRRTLVGLLSQCLASCAREHAEVKS